MREKKRGRNCVEGISGGETVSGRDGGERKWERGMLRNVEEGEEDGKIGRDGGKRNWEGRDSGRKGGERHWKIMRGEKVEEKEGRKSGVHRWGDNVIERGRR